MKRILLFIIILILLSGCGIYNPNGFVIPDDFEFLAFVESFNTPEKISEYMQENFTYEAHPFTAVSPYQLWLTRGGDCNDFALFGTWMAHYHGYETYQIEIYYGTIYTHWLGVYVEGNYSFTDNQYYYPNFNTFRKIVEENSKHTNYKWLSYKIYDYEMNIIERGYK